MTSAATKHRLQVLSPRAARHHSIASSHIPARPTSIKSLACCFPHKQKGATKHLRQIPQNSQSCTRTRLSMTLGPRKQHEFVAKLHVQFILHILFCRQRPLVHRHRQVFWEKFIFPVYKHAFRDWKDSSPATHSAIYPPYLKSHHDECALKSNLD